MSNGITYVTPDPCPHCGGRVSTGIAGDEDSEKYMYVCGQCDTWFEQKGYPTTSKRYVTEESEVVALRARVAELEAERDRYRRALEPDERGTCPVCKWSVSPGHPESHMQGCRAAIALNP